MGRVLQLLILIAFAIVLWRLVRKFLTPPPVPGPGDAPRFEPTGRCARCGTHVPSVQLDAAGLCAHCRS